MYKAVGGQQYASQGEVGGRRGFPASVNLCVNEGMVCSIIRCSFVGVCRGEDKT